MDNMPFEQKVTLSLAAFMPENIEKEKFFAFFDIEEHNDLNELIRHGWVSENVQAHTINVHPIVKYLIAGILNSDNAINKNVVDKLFISMSKGINDVRVKIPLIAFTVGSAYLKNKKQIPMIDVNVLNFREFIILLESIANSIVNLKIQSNYISKYILHYIKNYILYINIDSSREILIFVSKSLNLLLPNEKVNYMSLFYECYAKILLLQGYKDTPKILLNKLLTDVHDSIWEYRFLILMYQYMEEKYVFRFIIKSRSFFKKYKKLDYSECVSNEKMLEAYFYSVTYLHAQDCFVEKFPLKSTIRILSHDATENAKVINNKVKSNIHNKSFSDIETWTCFDQFKFWYANFFYHKSRDEKLKCFSYISDLHENGKISENAPLLNVYMCRAEIAEKEKDYITAQQLYQKCLELNENLGLHKENTLNAKLREIAELTTE